MTKMESNCGKKSLAHPKINNIIHLSGTFINFYEHNSLKWPQRKCFLYIFLPAYLRVNEKDNLTLFPFFFKSISF